MSQCETDTGEMKSIIISAKIINAQAEILAAVNGIVLGIGGICYPAGRRSIGGQAFSVEGLYHDQARRSEMPSMGRRCLIRPLLSARQYGAA